MHTNVARDVFINGSSDEKVVVDAFAGTFESIYFDSKSRPEALKEFDYLFSSVDPKNRYVSSSDLQTLISVEQIDRGIRNLKLGKANGPDELSAEHLLHAHPSLVIHLCLLFRGIAVHGYVPDAFGDGIIIPLLKDKLGNANDLGNYRGITLIPVVSKLFELVLLEICKPYLITDDLQMGFKRNMGCSNAIFHLSEVADFFTSRESSVYIATLDFKKAFDRVNHYKLFSSLLKAKMPAWIVRILHDWYGKLHVAVRWKAALSRRFNVGSGVRQGSSLSPALFNLFINIFIINLKKYNSGCIIDSLFVGAIMYADDLLLLSASVEGLQRMLDVCSSVGKEVDMEFNSNKCICSAVGVASHYAISAMSLGDDVIQWSNTFKYLGVSFIAGRSLLVDTHVIKCKFFSSCNCIFGKINCLHDMLKLSLIETFCLPTLLYATVALKLSKTQINELNASWNSVYRRFFGFNKWESVRCFINGLGRLDFSFLRLTYT